MDLVEERAVVGIAGNLPGQMKDRGSAFDRGRAGGFVQDRPFDHLDALRPELRGARSREDLDTHFRPEKALDEVRPEKSRSSGDEDSSLHDFFPTTAGFSAFFSSRSL